ncbi:MAG: hypothetical protein ACKPKO_12055, partial [Candidatus Fonsibacter sp.]
IASSGASLCACNLGAAIPSASRTSAGTVRIVVDLCGVILAKWPARVLQNIHTPQYVAQGLVAGAMDWLEECVANCGSLNVFITNNVGSPKLKEVFNAYLLIAGN